MQNNISYDQIEDIVLVYWFAGLKKSKDYSIEELILDIGESELSYDVIQYAQQEAHTIIEAYYESDRLDAELEAKYYPLPEYR